MTTVSDRLAQVRDRIARAASESGRAPDSARLIAVSKRKSTALIREAYAAGQRDFGENYVQELVDKANELRDLPGIRWHVIGHLQRNKAKHVTPLAHRIHSVDSERLALELANRAATAKRNLSLLVEVNIGAEDSKSGCEPGEAARLCNVIRQLEAVELRGLMTIPPANKDASRSRQYFDELVALRDALGGATELPELSMGMTADLEHAVAAGATWVRVGTAIFGAREPRA